eukprot:TRINITY_DN3575_c0_g1_i1.p1 TRINITY_DN3575_c0_g1~~TRINITY_DN3575_c0_g1_i1.p1  ORF type:complete len:264 (-),score=28.28 TRINITY_DN3575_c0_g1_i1:173-964(-)
MKSLLFILLIASVFAQETEIHAFRYKNASMSMGNTTGKIDGSLYYEKRGSIEALEFVGIELSTLTPFMLILGHAKEAGTDFNVTANCVGGAWGYHNPGRLSGTSTLVGPQNKTIFEADCASRRNEHWKVNATCNKSETLFYPPKEAGYRAKKLIGQNYRKFQAPHVVTYAVMDFPYVGIECRTFLLDVFPDAPGPEPGAIIVGNDGRHCGIVDDEGTKFVHSNPYARKVAYDPVSTAFRYFRRGFTYKRYPGGSNQTLLHLIH